MDASEVISLFKLVLKHARDAKECLVLVWMKSTHCESEVKKFESLSCKAGMRLFACVCTSISFSLAFCLNYYCAHSISGPCIWAEREVGGIASRAGSFSWSAQTTQEDITTSYVLVSYPSHCDTFSPSTLILNFPAQHPPCHERVCVYVCEYNVPCAY